MKQLLRGRVLGERARRSDACYRRPPLRHSARVIRALAFALGSGLACATGAIAAGHALIMGVANYPVQPLPGVHKDTQNMQALAKDMQIPASNITVLRDRELTSEGIVRALKALDAWVKPGDQVLVYFSGHGTSYTPLEGGACRQALVGHDLRNVDKSQLQALLQPVLQRSSRSWVFLDTCFSGGLLSGMVRGGYDEEATATAKFMASRLGQGVDPCANATNVSGKVRDFNPEPSSSPALPQQALLLAAATSEQVAIDGGRVTGGFATHAITACARDKAADTNRDGITSVEETIACAQQRINSLIEQERRKPNFPYTAMTLTSESSGLGGATPLSYLANNAPQASTSIDGKALLKTLSQNADVNWKVELNASQPVYQIGQDFLGVRVRSQRSGYLTLVAAGSSGKLTRLFPNRFDANNRVEAGQELKLPRPHWLLRSKGPAGSTRILALMTHQPDPLASAFSGDGAFLAAAENSEAAKNILTRLNGMAQECGASVRRDYELEQSICPTAFGAAWIDSLEQ